MICNSKLVSFEVAFLSPDYPYLETSISLDNFFPDSIQGRGNVQRVYLMIPHVYRHYATLTFISTASTNFAIHGSRAMQSSMKILIDNNHGRFPDGGRFLLILRGLNPF